jgi:serine phosphatase RsbU (regulator of sigma subunit)
LPHDPAGIPTAPVPADAGADHSADGRSAAFPAPSLPNRLATVMVFNLLIPVAVLALFKGFGDYQTVLDQTFGRLERFSGTLGDVWESSAPASESDRPPDAREYSARLRSAVHKLVLESRADGPTVRGAAVLDENGVTRAAAGELSVDDLGPALTGGLEQLGRVGDPRTSWSARLSAADGGETFVVIRPATARLRGAYRSYLLTVFDSTGVRQRFRHRLAWLFAMDAGLAALVGVLAYLLVYRFVLRPVHTLHAGARRIAEGRLEHRLSVNSPDELGLLAGEFNAMAERLEADYRELQRYNRQLKADREYAGQLQRRLLPAALPAVEGFEFSVQYHPCEDVGGDFYDVFRLDDGRAALYVADVAGHGIGAALITVFIRQTIAHLRAADPAVLSRPAAALAALRRRFVAEDFGNVFVSMIYGVLDPATGRLRFAGAGHPMPMLATPGGEIVTAEDNNGPVITGLLPEMPFPEQEMTLPAGGRLLLYTDGATDAMAGDGRPFGVDRLARMLLDHPRLNAEDWTRRTAAVIREHVGTRPLIDDVTLLTVTCAAARPAPTADAVDIQRVGGAGPT